MAALLVLRGDLYLRGGLAHMWQYDVLSLFFTCLLLLQAWRVCCRGPRPRALRSPPHSCRPPPPSPRRPNNQQPRPQQQRRSRQRRSRQRRLLASSSKRQRQWRPLPQHNTPCSTHPSQQSMQRRCQHEPQPCSRRHRRCSPHLQHPQRQRGQFCRSNLRCRRRRRRSRRSRACPQYRQQGRQRCRVVPSCRRVNHPPRLQPRPMWQHQCSSISRCLQRHPRHRQRQRCRQHQQRQSQLCRQQQQQRAPAAPLPKSRQYCQRTAAAALRTRQHPQYQT